MAEDTFASRSRASPFFCFPLSDLGDDVGFFFSELVAAAGLVATVGESCVRLNCGSGTRVAKRGGVILGGPSLACCFIGGMKIPGGGPLGDT
jgi:hypothetical protein